MNEAEQLEQAIAALEAQRPSLGDTLVDAMLAPAREKLAALKKLPGHSEGERRQVTVLFADVSGFTSLSEDLDAEDVRDTMNALWKSLDSIITAHGGHVDKHIGDAVMALWGTEAGREDDPEQAILAALAMQEFMKTFGSPGGGVWRLRIGVNTGPVLWGSVGTRHEFTVMGDTVNVASRLEQAAPPGGVLVSHTTYRHVHGLFEAQVQPALSVKGKAEPLQSFLVTKVRPRAFRMCRRGVEGIETRLVGRQSEMASLQAFFNAAGANPQGRTVALVADAGIGKSRLLHEFLLWAELQSSPCWLFRCQAYPGSVDTPWALFRDLVSYRFGIQEGDPPTEACRKLEEGMAALCPEDPRIGESAAFLGHLVGFEFPDSPFLRGLRGDTAQIRALALGALASLFTSLAARHPLMVVIEDAHWSDQASLDALHQVLAKLPDQAPVLLLIATRPSFFDRQSAWESLPLTRLDLAPLCDAHAYELVRDILQKAAVVPEEFCDLIVSQAEGNPFHVEELIKMLIDRGTINTLGPTWEIKSPGDEGLQIPSTLSGVLQARIDSLPTAERLALQHASVLGRIFWDTAATAIGGNQLGTGEFNLLMESAARREMVHERQNTSFLGAREYSFKHAILRDVIYESMLKRKRMEYHAVAAQWLESAGHQRRNDFLPQIAWHQERAGRTVLAAQCLEQAGDAAAQASAFAEAVEFYQRAALMDPSRAQAGLALKKSEASYRRGDWPAARAGLETALQQTTSPELRGDILALMAEIESAGGDYPKALGILAEAVPLARNGGKPLTLCRALYALGDVLWRTGDLARSREALEESLDLAVTLGEPVRELFAMNRLGLVVSHKDMAHAEALFHEVHERAVALGNRERAMVALNNLGTVSGSRGDYPLTLRYFEGALAMAREIGAQDSMALILINKAGCHCRLSQSGAARDSLGKGLPLARRLGIKPWVVSAVIYWASLLQIEGRQSEALRILGLARCQPSWSSDNQRDYERLITSWGLDPAEASDACSEGAGDDWEAAIEEITREVQSPRND